MSIIIASSDKGIEATDLSMIEGHRKFCEVTRSEGVQVSAVTSECQKVQGVLMPYAGYDLKY